MPPRHCVQHLRRIRSPLHLLQLTVVLHTYQAAPAAALGLGLHPALPPDRAEWRGAEQCHSAPPWPPKAGVPGSWRRYAHGTSCSRPRCLGLRCGREARPRLTPRLATPRRPDGAQWPHGVPAVDAHQSQPDQATQARRRTLPTRLVGHLRHTRHAPRRRPAWSETRWLGPLSAGSPEAAFATHHASGCPKLRPPSANRSLRAAPAGPCRMWALTPTTGANRSDADRPVVYLTFSRIWYRDMLNP